MIDLIKKMSEEKSEKYIQIRHHLHQNPELSFKEFNTALYIFDELKKTGINDIKKIAGTGWVAHIQGEKGLGPVIALRADMDALPIDEKNDITYKSANPGVMHACGHDVHMTCLLGAAEILFKTKHTWGGTVKLIFQPGEEKLPGGASKIIEENGLKNPDAVNITGQHVMPFIPAGKVGFREGLYMASTDELYITVKGKGGHGAMPHLNHDPISAAAQMIITLQQLVSRVANPAIPTVLSFGKIMAEGATNVIPNSVYLEGTFRTMNESWRREAHEKMMNIANHTVAALGCEVDFNIIKGYPFLYNDIELTRKSKKQAIAFLGEENVLDLDIWMAAEDFSYYSQQIPACFYRLGTGNIEKGIVHSVHHPQFNIDESAIQVGIGLMAWMAYCQLNH